MLNTPKAEVAKPEVVASLGVNAINFKPGSAVLSAGSKAKLKKFARLKIRNSDWNGLEVGGHTDVTGKEPKNDAFDKLALMLLKKQSLLVEQMQLVFLQKDMVLANQLMQQKQKQLMLKIVV